MRQNLALVVGLQGRFAEAETIASADLPPDEAAANVGYLRQMLAQRSDWTKKGGPPYVPRARRRHLIESIASISMRRAGRAGVSAWP